LLVLGLSSSSSSFLSSSTLVLVLVLVIIGEARLFPPDGILLFVVGAGPELVVGECTAAARARALVIMALGAAAVRAVDSMRLECAVRFDIFSLLCNRYMFPRWCTNTTFTVTSLLASRKEEDAGPLASDSEVAALAPRSAGPSLPPQTLPTECCASTWLRLPSRTESPLHTFTDPNITTLLKFLEEQQVPLLS
jgi:hypothetical protein